jgi:hypothetical protein
MPSVQVGTVGDTLISDNCGSGLSPGVSLDARLEGWVDPAGPFGESTRERLHCAETRRKSMQTDSGVHRLSSQTSCLDYPCGPGPPANARGEVMS